MWQHVPVTCNWTIFYSRASPMLMLWTRRWCSLSSTSIASPSTTKSGRSRYLSARWTWRRPSRSGGSCRAWRAKADRYTPSHTTQHRTTHHTTHHMTHDTSHMGLVELGQTTEEWSEGGTAYPTTHPRKSTNQPNTHSVSNLVYYVKPFK